MDKELQNVNSGKEPAFIEETESLEIYIDGVRWYTYQQLSVLLGLSISAIYKKAKAGKIQNKKVYGLSVYR